MSSLTQIQQDIASLPPEAQQVIFDLVKVLKHRYPMEKPQIPTENKALQENHPSTYQQFLDSGLIGCVAIDENLSTTYKQALAEGLAEKYDYR